MEGRKTRSIKLGRWERRAWGEASPHLPCGSTRNEKPKCHPALGSQNTKLRSRVQGAWYKTGEYSAGWPWAWQISSIKHPPDLSSSGIEWLPDPGCRAALRLGCHPSCCQPLPLHTCNRRLCSLYPFVVLESCQDTLLCFGVSQEVRTRTSGDLN